jgi:uncharacterized protein (TIGR02145 family)
MMKRLLFLIAVFCVLKSNAQNYLISFTGAGETTTVSTVKVENLDAGTSLILRGNQILHLTSIISGINTIENRQSSELKIYPNPMTGSSTVQFYPPVAGEALVSLFDMSGKSIAQIQGVLNNSLQEFRLSGLKKGLYLINVKGNSYQYSGKLLCIEQEDGTVAIEKTSNNQVFDEISLKPEYRGTQTTVDMQYSAGDTLKFTGISENYITIMTDIPEFDKTIAFSFISCTDGDNNSYPVVKIGTQLWMAENLKTTKYYNGTDIPLVNTPSTWKILTSTDKAYSWYNDDIGNKNTYGALYTWAAAMNGSVRSTSSPRDVQGACPTGWHLPGINEWDTLTSFLGGQRNASRRLQEAGPAHWINPDPEVTNKSGFTGLPGGFRLLNGTSLLMGSGGYWWSTSILSPFTWTWFFFLPFNFFGTDIMSQTNGLSVRCLKDSFQNTTTPSLSTNPVSFISDSSATSGGNISSDGGTNITFQGVCWSKSANPTIADNYTSDTAGTGIYSSNLNLTEFRHNTTYFIRAYATNSMGTAYGNEILFTTKGETGVVLDSDGNTYSTILIGTQTWMAENLRTGKYNDGTAIPLVTDGSVWSALASSAYCWFDNNEATYKASYGALYNWYSVNTGKLCPAGWHVPDEAEWTILTTYLGGTSAAGDKLKESGTAHWLDPDMNATNTNESGFTALPGSYRYDYGSFDGKVGYNGYWWMATENDPADALYLYLVFNSSDVTRYFGSKKNGFSVRCVMN